jgi:ribonuclease P protein component
MVAKMLLNAEKHKVEPGLLSNFMLPRQFRLPATVRLHHPDSYQATSFQVKIASNKQSVSRFGFIIGKSVAKEATTRNRARRLLRSCVEDRLTEIKTGYDMLFLLKKGIIDKDRETLASEIAKLLTHKKLLLLSQDNETHTT